MCSFTLCCFPAQQEFQPTNTSLFCGQRQTISLAKRRVFFITLVSSSKCNLPWTEAQPFERICWSTETNLVWHRTNTHSSHTISDTMAGGCFKPFTATINNKTVFLPAKTDHNSVLIAIKSDQFLLPFLCASSLFSQPVLDTNKAKARRSFHCFDRSIIFVQSNNSLY